MLKKSGKQTVLTPTDPILGVDVKIIILVCEVTFPLIQLYISRILYFVYI